MKKLLFLLLLPVSAFSQTSEKEFKVKGELKLIKAVDWIFLKYPANGQLVSDSVLLKNGEFKFEGKIAEPVLAYLSAKVIKSSPTERQAFQNFTFFLEPTKIEINAKDSLKAAVVKGSAGHDQYVQLEKQRQPYVDQLRSLYAQMGRLEKEKKMDSFKIVEVKAEDLMNQMNETVYGQFVKTNPNTSISLFALKQYAGWDIDPDKIEPIFNTLPENTRKWPSAETLNEQIQTAKKTAIGKFAMDFTQNDTSGKAVSLSSFKGKYVLVDFWASWCGPCRQENPNVVKAFNKYKDRNFTILGVSLDRPNAKDRWIKAIHDDGLAWSHVSDLKYWDNEVAKQYAIRAIPQNILIDPQGKIVAKNLNGDALDKKLGEFLN